MKILRYKNDCNTTEIVNKELQKVIGNVYHYSSVKDYETYNHYYIKCKNNLGYPLTTYEYRTPTQLFESLKRFENYSEKEILEQIIKAKEEHKYINNLQILFVECMGLPELLEELKVYKLKITQERELERKLEEEKRQQKEAERIKAEEEQKQKELEKAYNTLKSYNKITAHEFEILCNDNNINLPSKFVGWLREFCDSILIKPIDKEKYIQEYGYYPNFVYNYETSYRYVKGHKSSSIEKFTNELAKRVGI